MAIEITFELDDSLYEKMQTLAADMERSLDELLVLAVEDFQFSERERIAAIREGVRDCEEGRVISHEEVGQWIRSLSTDDPLPNPAERFEQKLAS